MAQPFNPDPRERGGTPNTTALGPDFPKSLNDLWYMVFRPSQEFLRYVKLAVSNDDGTPIAAGLSTLLEEIDAKLEALNLLAAAARDVTVLNERVAVSGQIYPTETIVPTGIAGGVAYANLDAMGTVAVPIRIPRAGVIYSATLFDFSDQGQAVELWLLTAPITAQTDNGALTLTDTELRTSLYTIYFSTFKDAANGQVSFAESLGKAYRLGSGPATDLVTVYAFMQARGTPTVTLPALPQATIDILVE